jgi:hypothetical protein
MKQSKARNLGWGEYILPDQGQNTQIAGARWKLMEVVQQVLPQFFQRLREQVYPTFARLAQNTTGYWEPGWTFETWQLQSDGDRQLTPYLLAWAKAFHVEETWILDGALQTLALWHQHPDSRESLDICGFRTYCAVDTLNNDEGSRFRFGHYGWDPQSQTWARFRDSIQNQFKKQMDAYEQRLRSLLESQGAVRVRHRYSLKHFQWFALYQLGGLSTTKLLKQYPDLGDESTILKVLKTAAGLLQWTNIRKVR